MVFCLQNHDQIGNRPFGGRLNHQIAPALFRALSALLLFVPETPLLFMGQEWAASTRFLYFTDHHAELGRLVTTGRREASASRTSSDTTSTRLPPVFRFSLIPGGRGLGTNPRELWERTARATRRSCAS